MGQREAAEARGRRAEALAAWWLRAKGYSILARRVKLPVGEIDLVAEKRGVIAFIEVKERATLEDAMGAVTPGAWRRIARAAETWMAQRHASTSAAGGMTSSRSRRAGCRRMCATPGGRGWGSQEPGSAPSPFLRHPRRAKPV